LDGTSRDRDEARGSMPRISPAIQNGARGAVEPG